MSARTTVVLLATLLLAYVPASARAQAEILEQGNQLYLQGEYPQAVEAYETVLSSGYESFALHYNLGNAYFKVGDLGRAILEWERARAIEPADPDVLANLELGRSRTADAIVPLPRFWLFSAVAWWVDLFPRGLLIAVVAVAWLAAGAGIAVRILARGEGAARVGTWAAIAGGAVAMVLGINLFVRELNLGQPDRGVILAETVPVRSAPADDDDLTLFEIHEGTRVRIDERAGEWAEVVLDDGKVGWVESAVFEEI